MASTNLVAALADFAVVAGNDGVPEAMREDATLRLLDIVGLCLCVHRTPDARSLYGELQIWREPGASSVIGFGTASAPAAALANGIMGHAEDFDDTHTESLVHVSSGTIPAALAVAEEQGASGRRLVSAIAAGLEIAIRVGLGAKGQFHARGFHATGIAGPFGAAAAAGVLMRLPAAAIANALAIAASQAAGTMEFLSNGSTVKRVHPGWAAHAGVFAARLARAGITGPGSALEGRYGLYRTHVGEAFDPGSVAGDLGTRWHVLDSSFKPYPCCNFLHAPIDALAALQREHGFGPEEVEALICELPGGGIPVCAEPQEVRRNPRSGYDAKFSAYYTLAAQLVDGQVGLSTFGPDRLYAPAIRRMMRRITCRSDPESESYPVSFGGKVFVHLHGGARLARHEPYNRGGPFRPMTRSELVGKFSDNARMAVGAAQAERLAACLLGIGQIADVREISSLLRATVPRQEEATQ